MFYVEHFLIAFFWEKCYTKKKCFYNWNEALEEMDFNLKL